MATVGEIGMDEHGPRASALLAAPAGCAFAQSFSWAGISFAEAVEPLTSFHLLGRAMAHVSVWRGDHAEAVAQTMSAGQRLRSYATELVRQPEAAWWFASLDRSRQLFAHSPLGAKPVQPVAPLGPPDEWERYAQKPRWGVFTSTAFDGISSFLVGESECFGDLGPLHYPYERYLLRVSPTARVFEIDGPEAWHRLCMTFPAPDPGGLQDGLLVPDFAAVAKEWDAVHLTFGGLLTAEQVRIEGPRGVTELQGWDAEQTVWLRWVFDDYTRLPDLEERLRAPARLR